MSAHVHGRRHANETDDLLHIVGRVFGGTQMKRVFPYGGDLDRRDVIIRLTNMTRN